MRLTEVRRLGRVIRWRIPGLARDLSFGELFREEPFTVLAEGDHYLISGVVGRIWTIRSDYPHLDGPEDFLSYGEARCARVVFASWAAKSDGGATITSEVRVGAHGMRSRAGLRVVRPLIGAFEGLIGSEALELAARRAESGG